MKVVDFVDEKMAEDQKHVVQFRQKLQVVNEEIEMLFHWERLYKTKKNHVRMNFSLIRTILFHC